MGFFVVFEGSDGAGKTTQIALLARSLEEQGMSVVCTYEPGGTAAGEAVREVMLGNSPAAMQPLTWAFLMNAARAELVAEVIRPALERDQVVLSDRYWYSTLAYQCAGDGVPVEVVKTLSQIATSGLEPDLVVFLDLSPETALQRKHDQARNVLDRRPLDFHLRVREAYRGLAQKDRDRWEAFDATQSVEELAGAIRSKVLTQAGIRGGPTSP